ncbi:MAG: SLC13 family permease [Candidatus Scalindua sp.]|nr:SLC13 family permease [Candidatus Scalindua sp.]
MGFDAIVTLVVVTIIFVALIKNLASPDMLFLGATAFLALLGIITPSEAFAGFSNSGMLTVAMLFVVAAGLRETGVLEYVGHYILGRAKTEKSVFARLVGIILPMSAFLNNTPIVAMFMPIVIEWSRRHRISPSKLLIPVSFLAILGGTCTLIGTSTNLVVNGLMIEGGIPEMGLFEIGKIGLPYAVIGIAYLFFIGRHILPNRTELLEQFGVSRREYLVEMLVQAGCRLVGQTIEAAGLRNLPGLFLIDIDRNGKILSPVGPDDLIEVNDRLVFTGVVSSIVELEKIPCLVPAVDPAYEVSSRQQQRRRLCEAVVSSNSPVIGKTIREADFREFYGAAVVAVHRGGSRVEKKIGDIILRPGDTLLLQTGSHFMRAYRNDPAFYLVSNVEEWRPLRRDRAWIAGLLFVVLIVLMTTELVPTLIAAALIAVFMVAMGCISAGEARKSVEWQVLVTIAASFGVGTALQNSGAATAIAGTIVDITKAWGPVAALAAIYLLGSIATELITNNAAAVLLFPFCLETARLYDVSSRPFIIALILAASASFMTPIGYQTNMMVYGPGGYRFSDFLRIGGPLNAILWIAAVILIPLFWPF